MASEKKSARKVAIFIFNETEELDMCGPLEVFAAAKNNEGLKAFLFSAVNTTADTKDVFSG